MEMSRAALQYLNEGKPVFPVGPDKKPLVPWKPYQETLPSEAQVVKWWELWPDANIGMATGKLSGLIVIDADSQESATRLASEYPEARQTKLVKTGRGWHIYFQYQEGIRNSAGKFAPGLDIRGEGGYVLLPPSKHETGAVYQWMNYNVLPLPEALAEKFLNGDPVYKGQRNDVLFRYGAGLRAKGFEEEAILTSLTSENDRRCRPPLLERELQLIAKSITRYPAGTAAENIRSNLLQDVEPTPLFEMPANTERWLWDQCLALGTFNVLGAKPGLGKTTLAANLCVAVSRGVPLLGRDTAQGKVLYMFLDGPEAELLEVFRRFNAQNSDPIMKVCCKTGDAMQWLDRQIAKHAFKLIVIDTFAQHKGGDINKDVERYLSDITQLAIMHHICFLFLHHVGKNESLMGNTQILGTARTLLTIRSHSGQRVFKTEKWNAGIGFTPHRLIGLQEGWLELGYAPPELQKSMDQGMDQGMDQEGDQKVNQDSQNDGPGQRVPPPHSPPPPKVRKESLDNKSQSQVDSEPSGGIIDLQGPPSRKPLPGEASNWREELNKKWKNFGK